MIEAENFNEACALKQSLETKRKELELDEAIAERTGDDAAIERAKDALSENLTHWCQAYDARKKTALALCAAIGVDPKEIHSSLYGVLS